MREPKSASYFKNLDFFINDNAANRPKRQFPRIRYHRKTIFEGSVNSR